MTQPKFILHWLSQSRAHRIVWLFEELDLPYELKIYKRTKEYRSPPELIKLHPLGRSPVLEIIEDNKSKYIIESGHIIQYLIEKYDRDGKLVPITDDEKEQVGFYLHFGEGTLQPDLVSLLVNNTAKHKAPWGFKFLASQITNGINKGFYEPHLLTNLDFLESKIKAQHELGSKYFVGHKLSGADLILLFPIYANIFSDPKRVSEMFKASKPIEKIYPHLYQWSQDIIKEPKLIKANESISTYDKEAKL
ncbi:glutathione S-transferase [Scheffersomyces coipomensis]|uniref:glutathione S-transferase n=1 Tax=Scheffersomyces coipomensis TaxID=1788519 RepID=UPI00315C5EF6